MLLNFKVGGFCSINEMQEITLTPFFNQRVKGTKYEDNYDLSSVNKATKAIVIYGGNSTGKTNLLLAIKACLQVIRKGDSFDQLKRSFCSLQENPEMLFEITLEHENRILTYEISFNKDCLVRECFLVDNREIYSFSTNKLSLGVDIPNKAQIEEIYSVRSTATLLSKLRDFISEQANQLLQGIETIFVLTTDPFNPESKVFKISIAKWEVDMLEEYKELTLKLFQSIDKTIVDFSFEEIKRTSGEDDYEFIFYRHNKDGERIRFENQTESQGVKRMIAVIGYLVEVIQKGYTLVIDEFDAPISTRSLLNILMDFIQTKTNKRGQLIVTSHNLQLFDVDYFASSQIYIVNKSESLSTVVNSLADYNIRSDKKRLAERFLQGAFEL